MVRRRRSGLAGFAAVMAGAALALFVLLLALGSSRFGLAAGHASTLWSGPFSGTVDGRLEPGLSRS